MKKSVLFPYPVLYTLVYFDFSLIWAHLWAGAVVWVAIVSGGNCLSAIVWTTIVWVAIVFQPVDLALTVSCGLVHLVGSYK